MFHLLFTAKACQDEFNHMKKGALCTSFITDTFLSCLVSTAVRVETDSRCTTKRHQITLVILMKIILKKKLHNGSLLIWLEI